MVKELEKWESELDVCIRCGYCYEHCPFFKLTGWEIDTPRGKLILIHGLLTGKIKPSKELTEKIYECFYCKECEKSCSAKVPITDIFTDARKALLEEGFTGEGVTVAVDEDICSGCGICVAVCKSEATTLKEKGGKLVAEVDRVKCKGCGVCISACPSGARTLKEGYKVSKIEMKREIDEYLNNAKDPKVIVFCCNWSIYPGLQLSEFHSNGENYKIIVCMCGGRISPDLIIYAFTRGAGGVMLGVCPFGECEHDGNYKAYRRVRALQRMFKSFGVEPERIKIDWFKTGEAKKLKKSIEDFVNKIAKMGEIK